jgi:hypothetical protein
MFGNTELQKEKNIRVLKSSSHEINYLHANILRS